MSAQSKRVIVGMSGGVDSSVAALLLKQQNYEVEGLFMKNWEEDDNTSMCSATQDVLDAEAVCNQLDIPLHTVNFSKEYWNFVFEHFLSEYQSGRTPNPDILCNREIKFKLFLNHAISLGADYIATGHYAVKAQHAQGFHLQKAFDADKDQSYFLYTLTQAALSKTLFPLGNYDKKTIREFAKSAHFPNHGKKDSTGLCFIGERKFKDFLNRFVPAKPGNIETDHGKNIGQHDGLMFYTLGQRQGLRIGGQANTSNDPWYVVNKDIERNVLIVAQGDLHTLLFKNHLKAQDLHWIGGTMPKSAFSCTAKIRYRQIDTPCNVTLKENNSCEVIFETPQRAITPGQSIVFYDDNLCLGGGIIQ